MTTAADQWLEHAIAEFVDCWILGNDEMALRYARQAKDLWEAIYLHDTMEMVTRGNFRWPWVGCPEADEATGWTGWRYRL